MGRRLAWAFVLVLSGSPAFAETVVLDAVLRGPGSPFLVAADGDYEVPGVFGANVFVFDLASVADPIVAAALVVVNPPGGFASPQRRETYAVFAVTDLEGYADAGAGALLGSIEVNEQSPQALQVPLAAPILRVLERTAGQVALSGRLTTLKKFDGSERLFTGTGPASGVPAPQLVLTTDPAGAPALAATLYVDDDADPKTANGSPGAPFASIVHALDLAAPGDVVQAAPGLYGERVLLRRDVELLGSGPEESILDVSELPSGGAIVCASGARVEGFRIRDLAPPPESLPVGLGRSAVVECAAEAEITGNVVEGNDARAFVLRGSGAWVHENEIHGRIGIFSIEATVEQNVIESTEVAIEAGSVNGDEDGAAVVRRNRVYGALSPEVSPRPCGLFDPPIHLTLASNVFLPPSGPDAEGDGGVALLGCVSGDVLHNTFHGTNGVRVESQATIVSNLLVNGTAGIQVTAGATAEIRNNDVFGNRAGFMGASTDYVIIDDQTENNGNISEDPAFVDAFFEDFRLRSGSPALDAGSDEAEDIEGDEDFDGDARVVDVVDMGAQEHQPDEELPEPALPVEVDLLPGKTPNELKFTKVAKGNGKVVLAILSGDELDAPADVDVASLILEREPVLRCSERDVNRDDRSDLVCSFPLRGISLRGWPISEPPACVRGLTHAGRKLLGCDEVEIVP